MMFVLEATCQALHVSEVLVREGASMVSATGFAICLSLESFYYMHPVIGNLKMTWPFAQM